MRAVGIRFELVLKSGRPRRPEIDPDGVVGPGDTAADVAATRDGVVAMLRRDDRFVLFCVEANVDELPIGGHVHDRRVRCCLSVADVSLQSKLRRGPLLRACLWRKRGSGLRRWYGGGL